MWILSKLDFYGKGPEDAYAANDSAVAWNPEPGLRFTMRLAAGTYTPKQGLKLADNGYLQAASGTDTVHAYYIDPLTTAATAGERRKIEIANIV